MAKMKSIENRFGVIVVFLLSIVICWFLWEADPMLIHSHLKEVRFTLYSILPYLGVGLLILIFLVRSSFRYCKLDFLVLTMVWVIGTRYYLNINIENRIQMILLFLVFYITFRLLTSIGRRSTRVIQLMLMFSIIVESISGFSPLYNWFLLGSSPFSAAGSFFTTEAYSCFLAVGFPLALGWVVKFAGFKSLRRMPTTWGKAVLQGEVIIALLCLVAITLRLFILGGASIWAAIGIGCIVVALEYGVLRKVKVCFKRNFKRTLSYLLLALVLFASISATIYKLNDQAIDARLFKWKNTLLAISDVTCYGVALGCFEGVYGDKEIVYFASETGTIDERYVLGVPADGYEWYLQVGVELGFIGVFLFLFLFGRALWQTFHFRKWERFGLGGALTTFFVLTFFFGPFETLPLCLLSILLLALSCSGWQTRLTPHWWGDVPGEKY